MDNIIIPKQMTHDDLIVIARKEYERLLRGQNNQNNILPKDEELILEDDVLEWSEQAKDMKKKGELPVLNSLREI